MDVVFAIIKYVFLGFFGLVGALFVFALLFGKRVKKRWEYEAEFRDASGREFGEVDVELSRIEKEEPDYTFKASLRLRHERLVPQSKVQVEIDDKLVLEGMVDKPGFVHLGNEHIRTILDRPSAGQACRVLVGGAVLASAELLPD